MPHFPDYQPHWWDAQPLTNPIPVLTFAVAKKRSMPDNLSTASSIFDLYSVKLIRVLEEVGINFETFPAILIDQKTKEELSIQYRIFHLLEIYPAIDKLLSNMDEQQGNINKIVLTKETFELEKLFFRVKESPNIVLIHQRLKNRFDEEKITGCLYTPVEEFQILNLP